MLHSEQLSRKIAKVFLDNYAFEEDSTGLLDFACGTGESIQSASNIKQLNGFTPRRHLSVSGIGMQVCTWYRYQAGGSGSLQSTGA